jgi:hypothetical protein
MRPPALATILIAALAGPLQAAERDPWAFVQPAAPADPREDEATAETPAATLPVEIDWSLLETRPAGGTVRSARPDSKAPDSPWTRNERGPSTALSVKQPLLPLWDTRVGADMTVPSGQTPVPLPEKIASDARLWQSSGVAWAAMSAPGFASFWDKTAVEAKVDPGQDKSRLGTSISKTVPIDGQAAALTLQGGYNVVEQSLVPVVGGRSLRSIEADRSAKLSFGTTGTSLIASENLAADRWLRSIGAEQKLIDGMTISGTLSEIPTGGVSKSLTAGFKKTW